MKAARILGSFLTLRPRLSLFQRLRSGSPTPGGLLENLGKQTAWDRFYLQSSAQPFRHFDWFLGYSSLNGILLRLLEEVDGEGPRKFLDLGCGTSELGPRLYCRCPFPLHVDCVDFSPAALALMQAQFSPLPPPGNPDSRLRFREADATHLAAFQPGTFDLILDKGTMDALFRVDDGGGTARRALSESLRVLRAEGSILQVSDEDPDSRIPWLESLRSVNVTVSELEADTHTSYFAYLIKPV